MEKGIKYLGALGFLGVLVALISIIPFQDYSLSFPDLLKNVHKEPFKQSLELTVDNLAAEYRKGCPKHQFKSIQLVSREPQVMFIEGFVTKLEAEFLVKMA
jgi:hypothetical protein